MKCKNCNCQVSADFKHSFTTNCCPKCGQTMMQEDVKDLYIQMNNILSQDGNDLGDLAIWLVNTRHSKVIQSSTNDLQVEVKELEPPDAPEEEVTQSVAAPVKKPVSKVRRTQTADKEHSLLSTDRANLFSKRAGVDKIKYETLIKDIQGELVAEPTDMNDIGDGDGGDEDMSSFNADPLSNHEIRAMSGLFETPDSQMNYNEIEKIQKLEQLAMTGSVGKIRRSS